MGLLSSFASKAPGDVIKSSEWNSNFAAVVTWANAYPILKDVSATVSVTHTWSSSQSFSGGWTAGAACTVSTGGLTVTAGGLTVTAGGLTINGGGLTVASGTETVGAFVCHSVTNDTSSSHFVINSIGTGAIDFAIGGTVAFRVDSTSSFVPDLNNVSTIGAVSNRLANVWSVLGNFSGLLTAGGNLSVSGTSTLANALTVQNGGVAVTGASTFSSTINGQTISSSAAFTGTLSVAGTTTLAVVTHAGVATFTASPVFQADLDCTTTGIKILASATFKITNAGGSANYLAVSSSGALLSLGNVSCNVFLGALSGTSDTTGFPFMPSISGAPTGNPGAAGAFRFDHTAGKFYVFNGTAWKSATLT